MEHANHSIKCSVSNCSHHDCKADYCTLNEIKVGCCATDVSTCAATECASFQLGANGNCNCH